MHLFGFLAGDQFLHFDRNAQFQAEGDKVRVCKVYDKQLLIHIVRTCTPSFTKSPSLVLIDPVLSEIQPFKDVKIYKEMYGHPDAAACFVFLTYLNDCISGKTSPIGFL